MVLRINFQGCLFPTLLSEEPKFKSKVSSSHFHNVMTRKASHIFNTKPATPESEALTCSAIFVLGAHLSRERSSLLLHLHGHVPWALPSTSSAHVSLTTTPATLMQLGALGCPDHLQGSAPTTLSRFLTLSLWLQFFTQLKTRTWQIYIYSGNFRTCRRDFLKKHLFKNKTLPSRSVFSVCSSHTYQDVRDC